jgi:hypothetical protein
MGFGPTRFGPTRFEPTRFEPRYLRELTWLSAPAQQPTLHRRVSLEMTYDRLAALRTSLSRGEALLILGQDHTPEFVDSALADANALFRPASAWRSFPELFLGIGAEPGARSAVTSLLAKHQPSVALLELASIPWSAVLTTAVDPVLTQAFLAVGSQRRVVELGSGQLSALSAARSGQFLQIVRAFGTPSMEGPSVTPASAAALSEARMIKFPAVLAALPRLLGLHGHIAVAAIGDREWLDDQSLTTLCHVLSNLPPGRVFWFGPAPAAVRNLLGDRAYLDDRSIHEEVRVWANDDQLQHELAGIRQRVFGTADRVLSLEQEGTRFQLRLTAQEWRSISRVGALLDDNGIDALKAQPAPKPELVAYLRRSHAGIPDWSGPARGFVFEREQVKNLIQAVRDFITAPKASIHARGVQRVPFVLSGSPAYGKTVGLLHAAWTLRVQYRLPVLWLLPGVAGVDLVAVERVCRLLESKGARWIILFLDAVEVEDCFRLKRRLESDGRRVVVVGSESRIFPPNDDELPGAVRRFTLHHDVTSNEANAFVAYLGRHQITAATTAASRDFLRMLATAVPEVEFGAFPSLLAEYERLVDNVDVSTVSPTIASGSTSRSLAEQLSSLFPHLASQIEEDVGPMSRFAADPMLRDLLNLVLFCAQLERPISVNLLLEVLGAELIGKYPHFASVFASTALIQEVELDQDGTSALTTPHQLHAMWLVRGLFPNRPEQLELLRQIATSFDWKPDAFPGDEPDQDFLLGLFRAVGPRGEYRFLYSSRASLDRLRRIIGDVREQFAVEQPKLLSLESIILGDLAHKDTDDDPTSAREDCLLALQLLAKAEQILRERRPSDARNFELQRALTLAADIRGTLINIKLRGDAAGVEDILEDLSRIAQDAMLAQSYSPTYHPLDVVFWSHRDARNLLPAGAPSGLHARLLETMEQALEVAREEGVESSQISRFRQREVELHSLRGESLVSVHLAKEMRERGDFGGEVVLARRTLFEIKDMSAQRRACLEELARLYAFRPKILQDPLAVRFLHSLWVRSYVPGEIGDGEPKHVKAPLESWRMLEDIARSRLSFEDQSDLPYALFFLGWALYEIDEPREATDIFSKLERQSLGNPRRVGELAVVTDEDGERRKYRGKVVNPRTGQVRISIPELDSRIMELRPEVEAVLAPAGLRLGEFVEVAIALNYRGAHPRPLREKATRGGRV